MFVERLPEWLRRLFPYGVFRLSPRKRSVYLTFDDGPIPEATPEVLDILDRYGIKATFFMVGDNVRKYPEIARMVRQRGHALGNHTFHHIKAPGHTPQEYLEDVREAAQLIDSRLFRPPHGWIYRRQWRLLEKEGYKAIFYDLVTRDYSRRLDAEDVFRNVTRYTRPGSIIVFHDSLKSIDKLRTALPRAIEWMIKEGYSFDLID